MANDWYEYVEYGTTNMLTILLQRNGFSRDTSLYIKDHSTEYVVILNGVSKIKRTLLECSVESIRKEVQELVFNAPELFID